METKTNFIESINDLPLEEYRRNVLSFMKGEYDTLSTPNKIQSIGTQTIIVTRETKEAIKGYFLRPFRN
jgi:hypothetical protein